MRTISNTLVLNAKTIHVNQNSITLELSTGEQVLIHRNVFNTLQKNPDTPTFITEREFRGTKSSWIAIPRTM